MNFKKSIDNFSAFVLCGTFCLSAVTKIIWWHDTVFAIEKLVLDNFAAIVVAIVIILLELSITSTIFTPRLWKYTGLVSAISLVFFTGVVFWGKAEGRITDCPCFGNLFGAEIGIILFIRNTILFILSVILANRDINQSDVLSPHQTQVRETN